MKKLNALLASAFIAAAGCSDGSRDCADPATGERYNYKPEQVEIHKSARVKPQSRNTGEGETEGYYVTFPDKKAGYTRFVEVEKFRRLKCE